MALRLVRSSRNRFYLGLALALACAGCGPSSLLDDVANVPTPVDPPLVCGVNPPSDPFALERESCQFRRGASPEQTLGLPTRLASELPIRHVIVIMRENRSFDHLFGKLHDVGNPEIEGVPNTYQNLDLSGNIVRPFHLSTTCLGADPDHQWGAMHLGINGGAMTGFVASAAYSTNTDGHFVMGYYEETDLPFYYWLAKNYAVGDKHFASLASGTFPNRNFLTLGTNAGIQSTGLNTFPSPDTPSIFRALLAAQLSWGVYTDGSPLSGAFGWNAQSPGVHPFQEILDRLDQGTLPSVAFVDGRDNIDDDHPDADLQHGERWLKTIYEHAIHSPQWSRLAIVWTYDEGGGFADHVPPPLGCAASDSESDMIARERGPRVPLVVISPWAKRGSVSHTVRDHTAITRFIEALFGLPALTARDANSDALFDMFDFSCDQDLKPLEAPEVGTGGCRVSK